MALGLIYYNITCITFYLLAFICLVNPANVNHIANRWFGVFLFAAGCAVLNKIIYSAHAETNYARLIAFNELSRYVMAPALYLSVTHFTSAEKGLKRTEYLHFIPFLVFFIFVAPAAFFPNPGLNYHVNFLRPFSLILSILVFASVGVQALVYWILSYRKLIRHQKDILLVSSDTTQIDLKWLRLLLMGIAVMIVLWLNELFLGINFITHYAPLGYLFGGLFTCYYLLAQKDIYPYEKAELVDINKVIVDGQENITVKQRFSLLQLNELKDKLARLMEAERLYLDNELSLPQLAKEMSISSHDLSYVLNEGFGVNFFQFVNTYRVEEAKQLMLSGKYKHLNILGIAYNAGFNSKTTFNTAFKKQTGLSPSEFISQVKSETQPATPAV